jgi:hypothetical protein
LSREEQPATPASRNKRIPTRIDAHDDTAKFAKNLASRTKSYLRRLAELLGIDLEGV